MRKLFTESSHSNGTRAAQITDLRNSAPNPWLAKAVAVLEDLHRESIQERRRRLVVEAEVKALKQEKVAA